MKHILTYKIFESRIGDYIDTNKIENDELKKIISGIHDKNDTDDSLLKFIKISKTMNSDNKFGIKYSDIITIKYNDTEIHPLFGEKRLKSRTNMLNVEEFNILLKKAINAIFPVCFFYKVSDFYEFDHNIIPYKYQKTYNIVINDKQYYRKYFIAFKISKKLNKITGNYNFYIYIITISNGYDEKRQYKTFWIDISNMGDATLTDITKNSDYIYPNLPYKIEKLRSDLNIDEEEFIEDMNKKSKETLKIVEIKPEIAKTNKKILNQKDFKNIFKKR